MSGSTYSRDDLIKNHRGEAQLNIIIKILFQGLDSDDILFFYAILKSKVWCDILVK